MSEQSISSLYSDKTAKILNVPFIREASLALNDALNVNCNNQQHPTTLYPASVRDKDTILQPHQDLQRFLELDLTTPKLNSLLPYLWLAGLPRPARPLHRQKLRGREILITEDPNEHLVWHETRLFLKPLPLYLLSYDFWTANLCGSPCSSCLASCTQYSQTASSLLSSSCLAAASCTESARKPCSEFCPEHCQGASNPPSSPCSASTFCVSPISSTDHSQKTFDPLCKSCSASTSSSTPPPSPKYSQNPSKPFPSTITDLHNSAIGLLLSYTVGNWLISHASDFHLAQSLHLLPECFTTYTQWTTFAHNFLRNINLETMDNVSPRYKFGELRLSRLNRLYWYSNLSFHNFVFGYISTSTWYRAFFSRNFSFLLAGFVYVTVVLSALQVGLGTQKLGGSVVFQGISYGFTIASIIAVVGTVVFVFLVWFVLFWYYLFSAWKFNKDASRRRQNAREALAGR